MQYSLKSLQRALAHTLDRPLHGIDLLRPYCNDRVCGSNTDQKLRYAKTGEQIILQSMSSARIADTAAAAAAESPLPTAKKSHDPSGPLEKLRLRRTIRYEMLF